MSTPILTMAVQSELDVVLTRQRARQLAELLGFGERDRSHIATAVAEIAHNAFAHAGGGRVEFEVGVEVEPPRFGIRVCDQGPGISDLAVVLDGRFRSIDVTGRGLRGTRRLMDDFRVNTVPGQGTTVEMGKEIPPGSPPLTPDTLAAVAARLDAQPPRDPVEELQLQNRELLRALEQERVRQDELLQLNRELEDTNRGVVALYAELDERVEQLRRANQIRAQFASYLSHEFRTPLDSMLALAGLLLNRVDGDLTSEQEKQVGYIQRSARDLLSMVDDLLDSARVESGQIPVHPSTFTVDDLFSALRATLRPLTTGGAVTLVFEEPGNLPPLHTDEAKLSQILRNLISNALKFTERGEVRVAAALEPDGERVRFTVRDPGVGIAPEAQAWIFEDFARVEGAVQRRVKGTGLGLPLSRKLARLLNGDVQVESAPGAGSRFTVVLPRTYAAPAPAGLVG